MILILWQYGNFIVNDDIQIDDDPDELVMMILAWYDIDIVDDDQIPDMWW